MNPKSLDKKKTNKAEWKNRIGTCKNIPDGFVEIDGKFTNLEDWILFIEKFLSSERQRLIEEVIEYIAYNQGWEESGDIYRKHYGLPIKYPKK